MDIKYFDKNIKKIINCVCKNLNNKSKYNDNYGLFDKYENLLHLNYKFDFIQMNIEIIWKQIFDLVYWIDYLGNDHKTGLELKTNKLSNNKFIIKLNNSNTSLKNTNINKLIDYKMKHPNYEIIYAVINCDSKNGRDEIIKYNDYEIRYLSGKKLLKFIFGKDYKTIVEIFRKYVNIFLNDSNV